MDYVVQQLLDTAKTFRYHRIFPFAVGLFSLLAVLYAPLPDGLVEPFMNRILFAIPFSVLLGTVSIYFQRPPQNKKGNIGVLFAIKSGDDVLRRKVSSDVIRETKRILESQQSDQPFYVFEVERLLADSVTDNKSANDLRIRCKAHMCLYGEAVQRKEQGKLFHVLRLTGLVSHLPVPAEISNILKGEMNALMPLVQTIEEENEISGFEIASTQMAQSVNFVIATAALLSHDGKLAVRLLEDIQSNVKLLKKHGNTEAIRQLKRLLPKRLNDAYVYMCRASFARWDVCRDIQNFRDTIYWIQKSDEANKNKHSIEFLLYKAMEEFVLYKNLPKAKQWIKKCEAQYLINPAWKYSAAFLEAYEGNLDTALQYYDAALLLEQGHVLPFQIEGFISWTLECEPEHTDLYFCLGYINENFKNDEASALINYKKFLDSGMPTSTSSTKAVKHACHYIERVST